MKRKLLCFILCLLTSVVLLSVAASAATEIEWIKITDVKEPVADGSPDTTISSSGSTQGKGYKMISVKWKDETTNSLIQNANTYKFIVGHEYTVIIQYEATGDYRFMTNAGGQCATKFSINGLYVTPRAVTGYETWKRAEFSYTFPAVEAPHTHSPSEWRFMGDYHYRVCTTCGDIIEQEEHAGGTATCEKQAKCTACGYDYGMTVACEYGNAFTPKGNLGHAYVCIHCGNYKNMYDHIPGPAATETNPQTCTECGYVITPVIEHKHNVKLVEAIAATCTDSGIVAHYECDGCGKIFFDGNATQETDLASLAVDPQGHIASDDWQKDGTYHWRTCVRCQAVMEETKMIHEQGEDGSCLTCNEQKEPPVSDTVAETEKATEKVNDDDDDDDKKKNNDSDDEEFGLNWVIVVLVAVACFGVGVTTTVIIIKLRKGK